MRNRKNLTSALTIAGSDSGGGAGVQADLHTFAALGVHGTTAITCITAQNPKGVIGIQPSSPQLVQKQLAAVFAELKPAAAKTGMLYSAGIINAVAGFLRSNPVRLVVDPVMVATSGSVLLKSDAVKALCNRLLPLAALITPNVDEAQILTQSRLRDVEDLRVAARQLHHRFGCAALVKGGHLRGFKDAVDIFYDGTNELLLQAPFVRGVHTHGTGCTYSAAIAACLARGLSMVRSVESAKQFITRAIGDSRFVGRHSVLGWAGVERG